jgi:hypothetical protein
MDWAFFHYFLGCVLALPHGGVLMNWFEKTFTEFGQRVICTVLLLILAVLVLGWE